MAGGAAVHSPARGREVLTETRPLPWRRGGLTGENSEGWGFSLPSRGPARGWHSGSGQGRVRAARGNVGHSWVRVPGIGNRVCKGPGVGGMPVGREGSGQVQVCQVRSGSAAEEEAGGGAESRAWA